MLLSFHLKMLLVQSSIISWKLFKQQLMPVRLILIFRIQWVLQLLKSSVIFSNISLKMLNQIVKLSLVLTVTMTLVWL